MLRILSMALLMTCAAPAMAQACKTKVTVDGLTTLAAVMIKGVAATDLTLDTGPVLADMQLSKDAKAKGYSIKRGERAALYFFRTGASVENADWRMPGTVATEETGFGVEWPHLLLKGKPVEKVTFKVGTADMNDHWLVSQAQDKERDGRAVLSFFDTVASHGFRELNYGADEDDAFDIWVDWQLALRKSQPLVVTFQERETNAELATVTFPPMTAEAMQAHVVAGVNALRKAVAENSCDTP